MKLLQYVTSLVAILLLSTQLSLAQIDYRIFVEGIDSLSKSVVYVENPQGIGTGTLIGVPLSDTSQVGKVYVLTAKHMLWKLDSLGERIGTYEVVSVYFNLKQGGTEVRKYVAQDTSAYDYAILKPIGKLRPFAEYDKWTPSIRRVVSFSNIHKGQYVIMFGFPFGIGFSKNHIDPITQLGIVASCDTANRLLLIDATVNKGNSGGPVYVLETRDSYPWSLAGIVFEYEPARTYVLKEAGKDRTGKVKYQPIPANASLGRVVLINDILKSLDKLR